MGLLSWLRDRFAKQAPIVQEPAVPSRLGVLEQESEPAGYLPPGHPVVTFSPAALEMRTAVKRLHAERKASLTVSRPGPRHGSLEWRIAEARKPKGT